MKHTKCMAIITLLLLLGVSGGAAQSLGDYARAARKGKPEPSSTTRHYDNDNLPTGENVSVVGPPPSTSANAGQGAVNTSSTPATKAPADAAKAAAENQKTADDWKKKLDQQKQKIDSLNHELDLDQREHRLRAAAYYGDAGARLRDSAQYDKDDAQYKSDVEGRQKAVAAAQQELDQMQEQARKAGIVEKDKDDANDKK